MNRCHNNPVIFLLICPWYLLLFQDNSTNIFSLSLIVQNHPPSSSITSPPYVHIHIPKTGGMAIEGYLLKNFYKDFIFTFDHNHTVKNYPNSTCLVVVREPTDRFISSYQYWRYGSNLFFRGEGSNLAYSQNLSGYEKWTPPVTSIFDFINAAGNQSHPYHQYVQQRLNSQREGRGVDDAQTWGVHFRPQSSWLKGGRRHQIILLRYSHSIDIFTRRFFHALRFLSLKPPNGTKLELINASNKKNATILSVNHSTVFPFNDFALQSPYRSGLRKYLHSHPWISQYYHDDLRLWAQIEGSDPKGGWRAVF